jgi:hypothetical protein
MSVDSKASMFHSSVCGGTNLRQRFTRLSLASLYPCNRLDRVMNEQLALL